MDYIEHMFSCQEVLAICAKRRNIYCDRIHEIQAFIGTLPMACPNRLDDPGQAIILFDQQAS
jgi:hypothetical protein